MPHKFETGFFHNVPFWHGLGTVLDESVRSFARLAEIVPQLGMEVGPKPLWVQLDDEGEAGFKVPDQVAMVRADGALLGIVGDRYRPVQNREAFAFLDDLVGRQIEVETAGTLESGRKSWIQCRAPESIKIAGLADEAHDRFVTFLNSFDGSTPVQAIVGEMRVGCWNTYNAAMSEAANGYKFKHTEAIEGQLGQARRALQIAERYWQAVERLGTEAIKVPFSDRQFMGVLDSLIPLPSVVKPAFDVKDPGDQRREANAEKERDAVKLIWLDSPTLQNIRGTAWAAINTWTEYTDHHTESRETHRSNQAENRMKRILFDTSLKDAAIGRVREVAGLATL